MARATRGADNPAPQSPDGGHTPPEVAGLLVRAATGDQQAWRHLVTLYARRVFALANSRLRDPDLAEEVTQSVFVTVATKLKSDTPPPGAYAEQGKFEPWLFRVAVNRVRDEIRRLSRRGSVGGDDALEAVADNGTLSRSNTHELASLRAAMASLNEADREIIEMRHHAGMSFAAVAEALDEPLGTVLARHHRALRKLKELMSNPASITSDTEDLS